MFVLKIVNYFNWIHLQFLSGRKKSSLYKNFAIEGKIESRSRYVFVRIIEAGILSCPRTHNIYFQNGPTTKFRSAVPYYSSHSPTRVHLLAGKSDKRTNKRFVISPILIETSFFPHLIPSLLMEVWYLVAKHSGGAHSPISTVNQWTITNAVGSTVKILVVLYANLHTCYRIYIDQDISICIENIMIEIFDYTMLRDKKDTKIYSKLKQTIFFDVENLDEN